MTGSQIHSGRDGLERDRGPKSRSKDLSIQRSAWHADALLGQSAERVRSTISARCHVTTRWATVPVPQRNGGTTLTIEVVVSFACRNNDPLKTFFDVQEIMQSLTRRFFPLNLATRVLFSEPSIDGGRDLGICELDVARLDHSIIV
jgi:hypothetical protein